MGARCSRSDKAGEAIKNIHLWGIHLERRRARLSRKEFCAYICNDAVPVLHTFLLDLPEDVRSRTLELTQELVQFVAAEVEQERIFVQNRLVELNRQIAENAGNPLVAALERERDQYIQALVGGSRPNT